MSNIKLSVCCKQPVIETKRVTTGKISYFCSGVNGCGQWCDVTEEKIIKKITIDLDGWVSLDDGTSEIGLGDIDVDVVIEDRRETMMEHVWRTGHTHDTIEDHVQCKECAQRACDASSRDMEKLVKKHTD